MAASLRLDGDRLLLEGAVDFANAASLQQQGFDLLHKAGKAVTVDLSGLGSENSITLAVVVQWQRAAAKAGKSLQLVGVPDQFKAIVGVSGLRSVLETV